jgi:hypothetical protein
MDSRQGAWIAICVVVGAVFAGAIGEGLGFSHMIALIFAGLGVVLGAVVARHIA